MDDLIRANALLINAGDEDESDSDERVDTDLEKPLDEETEDDMDMGGWEEN